MKTKKAFQHLDNPALRASFKKHTVKGLCISVGLLLVFGVLSWVPFNTSSEMFNVLMIAITVASVLLAIWYHIGRRQYYREFKRRKMRIRG